MKVDGRPLRKIRKQKLDALLPLTLQKIVDLDIDLRLFSPDQLEDLALDYTAISFPPVTQLTVQGVDVAFLALAGQSVLKEPSVRSLMRSYTSYVRLLTDKPEFVKTEMPEAPEDLFFLEPADQEGTESAYRAVCFATYLSCRFNLRVQQDSRSYFVEFKNQKFGVEDGLVLGSNSGVKVEALSLSLITKTRRKWPERTPTLEYLARILTAIRTSPFVPASQVADDLCLLFMLSERLQRGRFIEFVSRYVEQGELYKEAETRQRPCGLLAQGASAFATNDLRKIINEIQWGSTSGDYWVQLPAKLRAAGLNARTARRVYFRKEGAGTSQRPRPELIVSKLMSVVSELESL